MLLLEFQTKPDPDMALRVHDYTGLLLDQLRRQQRLDPDGRLRVLPVVVYSGEARWSPVGAVDAVPVSADGEPALAGSYLYRLLDLQRTPKDDATMRNPALAVLGIAAASTPAEAAGWVGEMLAWLPEAIADPEVRREFRVSAGEWLSVILLRLFPDADPGKIDRIRSELREGEEGAMFSLVEKMKEWEDRAQHLGEVRGLERGIAQGKAEERALLCKQARLKFGAAVAEELARRLEPVSDAEALDAVGGLIIECADGAELLARVRPNGAG